MSTKSCGISGFSDDQLSAQKSFSLQTNDSEGVPKPGGSQKDEIAGSSPQIGSRKFHALNKMQRFHQQNAIVKSTNHPVFSGLNSSAPTDIEQKTAEKKTLMRVLKFNMVGGIGIFVQFAALYFLKSTMHINYLTATSIAVEAAVIHNFLWHERFTWRDRTSPSWRNSSRRLLRFNLSTGAVSILGNVALMKIMVDWFHADYLLANAIAVVVCSLANFMVSEKWVFAAASEAEPGCYTDS